MDIVTKKLLDIQGFLKLTYGIVPMVAGADKFTNLLTQWPEYLNPVLAGILPFSGNSFMMLVGVIEMIAGMLVFFRPKIGAYVVCGWLVLIALSLLSSGLYLDIAVRDLVMAVGALALAQLSDLAVAIKK